MTLVSLAWRSARTLGIVGGNRKGTRAGPSEMAPPPHLNIDPRDRQDIHAIEATVVTSLRRVGQLRRRSVDEVLPAFRLGLLGLQHVLVMYAGAVAVPLILGSALKLPKEQVALLINADLFACGIATLIQSIGVGSSASACR